MHLSTRSRLFRVQVFPLVPGDGGRSPTKIESYLFGKLRNIVAALLASLTGCQPPAVNEVPTSATQVSGDSIVAPILKDLLEHHGVPTDADGTWLIAENGMRMTGAVVKEYPSPRGTANIQLDFYFELEDGRLMIESVGGLGATKADAVKDGIQNFTGGSFHVLLSSLFNVNADDQIEIENWDIAGTSRRVTIGGMNVRTFTDAPFDPPTHWFPIVQRAIENTDLPRGTHWFRCYYAQFDNKPSAVEVLLDNNDWQPIIKAMSDIDWPAKDDFYSVRVFGVIQDGGEP
ncbi:hypothetical protein Enr13x_09400 [Stieleria neptunia]|uniref:Uncharacterized protein n=1 Tax=Stieleria neptunia TaxID=2527979 RepID=A0A518HJT0_9BACT|nr:hypothetical protein Enr13x_09400 [Stieleria neptunia]